MDFLGKKYKFVKGDSQEEFLKAIGSPNPVYKADSAKDHPDPTTELIQKADGSFALTLTSGGKLLMEKNFKLGEEIDEELAGVQTKSVYTLEGNKLTQVLKADNGKVITFTREFGPKELKATNTVSGWSGSSTRYYEAV